MLAYHTFFWKDFPSTVTGLCHTTAEETLLSLLPSSQSPYLPRIAQRPLWHQEFTPSEALRSWISQPTMVFSHNPSSSQYIAEPSLGPPCALVPTRAGQSLAPPSDSTFTWKSGSSCEAFPHMVLSFKWPHQTQQPYAEKITQAHPHQLHNSYFPWKTRVLDGQLHKPHQSARVNLTQGCVSSSRVPIPRVFPWPCASSKFLLGLLERHKRWQNPKWNNVRKTLLPSQTLLKSSSLHLDKVSSKINPAPKGQNSS